ncbi:hypothetical protein ACTXT7_007575 [Hymenolepis weldensis]
MADLLFVDESRVISDPLECEFITVVLPSHRSIELLSINGSITYWRGGGGDIGTSVDLELKWYSINA